MERQELWDDLHRRDELRVERDRRLYEQEQEKWCYLQKVLPLPQRAAPRPWEDLASLLSRTANKMGYDHPRWLLHQENIPYAINSATLSVLHRRPDYLFLGRQMLLEEEQLYALTLHRFTSRLYLPQHSPPPSATYSGDRRSIDRPRLWYEDQQRFYLSEIYTRVCPLCLDEGDGSGGYDRLFWRCRLMLVCPRYHVFLVNRCPACMAYIPALRPNLLICPSCGKGDYRSAVLALHAKDAWLLTSHCLLLSHLGVESVEVGTQLEDSSPSLLHHLASWGVSAQGAENTAGGIWVTGSSVLCSVSVTYPVDGCACRNRSCGERRSVTQRSCCSFIR